MITVNKKIVISKYQPREVQTGKWAWVLLKRAVSLPMAVLDDNFGWHQGGNPPMPAGDASDPKARVASMRS